MEPIKSIWIVGLESIRVTVTTPELYSQWRTQYGDVNHAGHRYQLAIL